MKYVYPVDSLFTGSSLGNRAAFARLDERTNVHGLWSAADNAYYLGSWNVEIHVNGRRLTPVETIFEPEAQATRYASSDGEAEQRFVLPFLLEPSREDEEKLRAGIFLIRLWNTGSRAADVVVSHRLIIPAVASDKFTKNPPAELASERFTMVQKSTSVEITSLAHPHRTRLFSSNILPVSVRSDDRTLEAEYALTLQPGEIMELPFVFAFSPYGTDAAQRTLHYCRDASAVLRDARREYEAALTRTHLFTPNPMINRALQWAKVNTLRVQHTYRIGPAFTNDPPQDIVVVRDVAWYALGAEYLTPSFIGEMLDVLNRHAVHPDGKLTEYIHADQVPPALNDYHLNINDDTPLYLYALYHHALVSADQDALQNVYPVMQRAGDYILTQMRDGLVYCSAEGTGVWGICGWRNIIPDYTLNGAVTEVNAECFFALRLLASAAQQLRLHDDAARYERAARELKVAIDTKLVSKKTGLYVLNKDTHGTCHHDLTGDLIFPVLFDVADEPMRERILALLLSEKFWTPYGARTVSPDEPSYDPDFGYQLMGGVWPNLLVWIAMCVRDRMPEKLVEGMINAYRMCEVARPKDFVNVVPGQFPERLHGESFVSRGMALSPWMPPTYLWLGVEGLLGVRPSFDELEITPAIPSSWNWIAVRNLLYRGKLITAFLYDGVLYANERVRSSVPVRVGAAAACRTNNRHLFACAIVCDDTLMLFAAADEDVEGIVTVDTADGQTIQEMTLAAGEAHLYEIPLASLRLRAAFNTPGA